MENQFIVINPFYRLQNDHGGPLVTWVGSKEVLIGVASVFIVSDDLKCMGPYLYTSTQCNGAFLDCILSNSDLPDVKKRWDVINCYIICLSCLTKRKNALTCANIPVYICRRYLVGFNIICFSASKSFQLPFYWTRLLIRVPTYLVRKMILRSLDRNFAL